ncbi:MAG TPA: type II secretion system protein [Burkholderiales bacterium]|nr:type II secretion system protein [Burkholderiales bacterium]
MSLGTWPQRGFTYIGLLLAIAIMSAGLAAVSQVWHTVVRRANEAELAFVGGQFKQALERYYDNSPGGFKRFPQTLEELLRDPRQPVTVRYLRRIYADPITARAQWGLVKQDDRIIGVFSLSEDTPFRNRASSSESTRPQKYSDWKFLADVRPATAAPLAQSSTGSGVTAPAQAAPESFQAAPPPKETAPEPAPKPKPKPPTDRCERLRVQDAAACESSATRLGRSDVQCEASAQVRYSNCIASESIGPLWVEQ